MTVKTSKAKLKQVVEIFKKKGCNITAACAAANISRQTFHLYYTTDKEFKQMVEDAKESLIDFAESKLIELIDKGDVSSIQFFLRTKGKDRGYDTSSTVNLKGNVGVRTQLDEEALLKIREMLDGKNEN